MNNVVSESNQPNIKTIWLQKAMEWLLYATAFSLPLVKAHWNSKIAIAFAIAWLFVVDKRLVWGNIKKKKIIWLFSGLFILDVIGMIHSQNLIYGLGHLESKFTIVLFPIVLLSSPHLFSIKIVNNAFKAFIIGLITLVFICLGMITTYKSAQDLPWTYFFQGRLTDTQIFEDSWLSFHPSFISLYLSLSIFFLIEKVMIPSKKGLVILAGISLIIIFCIFEIWLNSRAAIAGLLLASLGFILLKLNRRHQIFAILALFVFLAILFSLPVSKERIIEAPLRAIKQGPVVDAKDPATWPISFRLQIIDCSLEILKNNRWLFGYGTGDFRDKINQCYRDKKYDWIVVRDFDAHSEYFTQVHRHGIVGLILFVSCLLIPFIRSIKNKQALYMVFIILIGVSAIPESIFTSQKGVVFYALFNSLLYLSPPRTPQALVKQ